MASYVIRCTDQDPVGVNHNAAHIKSVKLKESEECFTVADIYRFMDEGHQFVTVSPSTGTRAKVHKFRCSCGKGTLRSAADATTDNNLDNLPRCYCG